MAHLLYLVIRSLGRVKKKDGKLKNKFNRKFENILKRKMKSRRRKFKKGLLSENSTNEGSLIISTTVPETTTQHKIDENWYSYVDFLRENEVV